MGLKKVNLNGSATSLSAAFPSVQLGIVYGSATMKIVVPMATEAIITVTFKED